MRNWIIAAVLLAIALVLAISAFDEKSPVPLDPRPAPADTPTEAMAEASSSERPSPDPMRSPVETDSVAGDPDSQVVPVRGVVVGPDASPVAGAVVWQADRGFTARGRTVTHSDDDGAFSLERIPDLTCLWAWADGYAASACAIVEAGDAATHEVRLELKEVAGILRGLVVNGDREPIQGAEVWVGDYLELGHRLRRSAGSAGNRELRRALVPPPSRVTTDTEGRFTVTRVDPRQRGLVTVRAEGYAIWHRSCPVGPGEVETVRVVLKRAAALYGVVTSRDGVACAGAEVAVGRPPQGVPPWFRTSADTGPDGAYRIEGLTPGDQRHVGARHRTLGAAEAILALPPGVATRWDPQIDPGPCILGRLVDERGEGVAGVLASATPTREFRNAHRPNPVSTDDAGRFQLIRCSDADYRLSLVEQRSWIQSTLVHEPKIRPAEGERVFVVREGLFPTSYLTGKIRDAAGPVHDARIGLVWGRDGGGKTTGEQPVESGFRIGPLPSGRYIVRLFRDGAPDVESAPLQLAPDSTHDLGVLFFESFGVLKVVVPGVDDLPILARLENVETGALATPDPRHDGLYFEWLTPGDYVLRLSTARHAPQSRRVRISSGSDAALEVALQEGVRTQFTLRGFAPEHTLHWRTPAGETLFVESLFPTLFPTLIAHSSREPACLWHAFAPGSYVVAVMPRGPGVLERAVHGEVPLEPLAEIPFEVGSSSRPVELRLPK